MVNVVILGGKGGGTLAAQTVLAMCRTDRAHCLVGYLNDRLEIGTVLHGGVVIGSFDDWAGLDRDVVFVAPIHKVGSIQANAKRIADLGIPSPRWVTLIDPSANVAEEVTIGGGSVAAAGSQVGPDTSIGAHCFLRAGAIVSHDVTVADHVYLGQSSVVGGYSRVETGAHIAPGAIIRDGICIGRFAVVGMGAVVTKSVPPYSIVTGVPARPAGAVTPID